MDDIKLFHAKSKINLKRCISCGNCVVNSPEEAIQLIKKFKLKVPDENEELLHANILALKNKLREKNKILS